MSVNKLNFDIFYMILEYLDIDDIQNFIQSTVRIYNMYINNVSSIDILLCRKILEYFHFKRKISLITSPYVLLDIYSHFKQHPYSSRVDFLIYMIDKRYDSDDLFKFFISYCYLHSENCNVRHKDFIQVQLNARPTTTSSTTNYNYKKRLRTRAEISFTGMSYMTQCDLKYILTHSSLSQLNIILNTYTISEIVIAQSIEQILQKKYEQFDYKDKLEKCIEYFVNTEYHVREVKNIYKHYIISTLVYYKQHDLVKKMTQA
jgi:hypothetical protein